MTFDELGSRWGELRQSRTVISRELGRARSRRESAERLEGDRDALLGSYAGSDPEALGRLEPEERNRVYRSPRLQALLGADGGPSVEGIAGMLITSVIG